MLILSYTLCFHINQTVTSLPLWLYPSADAINCLYSSVSTYHIKSPSIQLLSFTQNRPKRVVLLTVRNTAAQFTIGCWKVGQLTSNLFQPGWPRNLNHPILKYSSPFFKLFCTILWLYAWSHLDSNVDTVAVKVCMPLTFSNFSH